MKKLKITSLILLFLITTLSTISQSHVGNTPTNTSPQLDLNNSNYPLFDSDKIDELVPIGNEMRDFKLYDFYGGQNATEFNLSRYDDKILIFDLMASWCGPCRDAMPEMVRLYELFHHTNEVEFISIGIDLTEPDADLDNFHEAYDMVWDFARDYVGAMDDTTLWSNYGSGYIPTYYITDKNNIITRSEIGWYGIESYVNEIKSLISIIDEESPTFVSMTSDYDYFSINSPSLLIEVDAQDNFGVKSVIGTAKYNDITIEQEMTYNYQTKKFEAKYKYDLIDLYAANADVTFTFSIIDWYGNTYTHTGETIDVKFTPDDDLPEITFLSAKEIENQNSLSIDVLLSVRDTFIQHVSITEINETGLNSTYLPQSSLSGALFKFEFQLNYSLDTNLACFTFLINLEDIAGNTVNQMFEVDLIDPTRASNCEQANTTSSENSTTQTDSAIFSIYTLPISLIFVLGYRKNYHIK
jgi:thiol-disulfide isomerase/thioredoxin